ncbi:MAG: PhnD/SsuA/transferrin family substrate-binding protein [Actinomycetota bacterium]
MSREPLRVITYLAPSIPERFFRVIADYLGRRLGGGAELTVEPRMSGPRRQDDPFELNEMDVGFMCAPSLVLLRTADSPSVDLLPVAPVFADERAKGLPIYFSDVVVRADSNIVSFDQLRGRTWAYNDARSLSGWHSALERLRAIPAGSEFFSSTVASGSHLESLRLVSRHRVDAAAIDSNALIMEQAEHPGQATRLRVIESWGPFPIQPAVVRASLPEKTKRQIADHLSDLHRSVATDALEGIPFERFAPVTYGDYLSSPAVVEAAKMVAEDSHH